MMKSFVVAIAAVLILPWNEGPLPVQAQNDKVGVIAATTDLSMLSAIITANPTIAALISAQQGGTLFAPTNTAIANLGTPIADCIGRPTAAERAIPLQALISYHMSATQYFDSDAANALTIQSLYVGPYDINQGRYTIPAANSIDVLPTTSGSIVVVDQVYVPPDLDNAICYPSDSPSSNPSSEPSLKPSSDPSSEPSLKPSQVPSDTPSQEPSDEPSGKPSQVPSDEPSGKPSQVPSDEPSGKPSQVPSDEPSGKPSQVPSDEPSGKPSQVPSDKPSQVPSDLPSDEPSTSSNPSSQPSDVPSLSNNPSSEPSMQPSSTPSSEPSMQPSSTPSLAPSSEPSVEPSLSFAPSRSSEPSSKPSPVPSGSLEPSTQPSKSPTGAPSEYPSGKPTRAPPLATVSNDSISPAGTTEASIEASMLAGIVGVIGRRRLTGGCDIEVDASTQACPSDVTDRTSVCFDVLTTIQEPRGVVTSTCDVNAGADTTSTRLRAGTLPGAGTVPASSVVVVFVTNEPSMQPSSEPSSEPSVQPSKDISIAPSTSAAPSSEPSLSSQPSGDVSNKPSNEPSLSSPPSDGPSAVISSEPSQSLAPTVEFPCVDNPDYPITITNRRRSGRRVQICSVATAKRCKKGRNARTFRAQCPATCRVPRCTCIDVRKITFKLNGRRFTKYCNKLKVGLCSITKVANSCPNRCSEPRCVDNNPQILPLY